MNHTKRIATVVLTVVLAASLSSCSGKGKDDPAVKEGSAVNDAGQNSGVTEPDVPAKETESETKRGTGIYNGQIDTTAVEIETADGPTSFQLSEGLEAAAAALEQNDPVTFEYVEKTYEGETIVKQLVLTKLEKGEASSAGGNTAPADDRPAK